METTKYVFTKADVGCWIDGAFGTDHACAKLQAMLMDCGLPVSMGDKELLAELDKPEGEWIHDAIDDATNTLDDYTEPGLVWVWEAGDLILMDESETD